VQSALEIASKNGHINCVVALMDAGADANRVSCVSSRHPAAASVPAKNIHAALQNKQQTNHAADRNVLLHNTRLFHEKNVLMQDALLSAAYRLSTALLYLLQCAGI
jgi:ankyrin repeat protein